MKDYEHPFFRPLWRRVAVVVVCVAWSIFEFATDAPFWGVDRARLCGYGIWQFFFLYKPVDPASTPPPETKE